METQNISGKHEQEKRHLDAKSFSKITKIEITFLVDMVAIAGFFSDPAFFGRLIMVVPLIAAGTLASMSAAIFNNLYDVDLDSRMKRTSYRGGIINRDNFRKVFTIASLMLAVSMAIAYLLVNLYTAVFILAGFLSYTLLYTIALKRRTTWNIVIGGIAGSFPALAGWAAVSGDISATAIFIAGLVFLWTPTHFWALATTISEDYRNAGIPMLPAKVDIKKSSRAIQANTIILVAYSLIPVFYTQINVGIAFYAFAAFLGAIFLYYSFLPSFRNFFMKSFKTLFHFSNIYLLVLLVVISFVNVV